MQWNTCGRNRGLIEQKWFSDGKGNKGCVKGFWEGRAVPKMIPKRLLGKYTHYNVGFEDLKLSLGLPWLQQTKASGKFAKRTKSRLRLTAVLLCPGYRGYRVN